ncbi:hypothetical protein Tco_1283287 [Tanacetum coccineum]
MDYKFDFIVIAGRSSYRRSAPKISKSTTPAPASSASSVLVRSEPKSGGFVANMVATVADGYIWATGSAMAHRAMDAIVGPRTIQIENVPVAQFQGCWSIFQQVVSELGFEGSLDSRSTGVVVACPTQSLVWKRVLEFLGWSSFFKCLPFELPEDVVNKTLQIILELQFFKLSLFDLCCHNSSKTFQQPFISAIKSYSFRLFSSLPGVLTPVRGESLKL